MKASIVIFYFSGTGNTWWLSEELTRRFRDTGAEARAYSIEKILPQEADAMINGCTAAGFGYPIYGSDLPQAMKQFIENLAPVSDKAAFVFCTQWMWSGDGARTGAGFLKKKGFVVRWGEHFLMPLNVCVAVTPFFPYTSDRSKTNMILAKTRPRMERFVKIITSGHPFRRGFDPFSFLLGCFQRVPFRMLFHRLRNDIGVDSHLCTRCGLCARLCPSGNLLFDGETVSTRGSCILCLRCYNFCPVSAVTYMKRRHNNRRGEPYRGPVENFDPLILSQ